MYAIREPLRKTRPTLSTPTSSLIQASSAPLVNVYASPQSAHSAMIAAGEVTRATAIHATPMPTKPMISDRRML